MEMKSFVCPKCMLRFEIEGEFMPQIQGDQLEIVIHLLAHLVEVDA